MSRKDRRQKRTGTRAASAAPTVTRMSRAPAPAARVSTVPPPPEPASVQPAVIHTLPEPVVATRTPSESAPNAPQVAHHWSDPPPRPQFTQPTAQPVPTHEPTPHFTVPQPRAQRVSERPMPSGPRTPPHGSDSTERKSDPGRRSNPDLDDHDHFFASVPPRQSLSDAHWDDHDDLKPVMAHSSKRAMQTTFWILGVSAVLIGAFLIYNQVIMPAPAQLTGGSMLSVPMPLPTAPIDPPAAVAAPAPVAAADPVIVAEPDVEAAAVVAAAPVVEAAPAVEAAPVVEAEPVVPAPEVTAPAPVAVEEVGGDDAADVYQALIDEAGRLARQGNRKRALETYRAALDANPNGDEALSKIAYHYLNTGKNDEAREYARRAVAANPKSSEGWIVLGAAREVLRDHDGAIEAYRQCATIAEGSFVTECRRLAR